VRVAGRSAPVGIFEPLGPDDALDPATRELARAHAAALERFRARDWDAAQARFEDLARRAPADRLPRIYLERIERLRAEPPGPGWDATVGYDEK
jgi:adenylate cyclase